MRAKVESILIATPSPPVNIIAKTKAANDKTSGWVGVGVCVCVCGGGGGGQAL